MDRRGIPQRSDRDRARVYQRRWWTLLVLSISLLVVILDNTLVNVALPSLQRALGSSTADLQWIVDAYVLVFAGLLLTMGALGDRFGRRRALQAGLATFGVGGLLGALAQSSPELIAARALMGIGGALVMPATLSILVDVFPRDERQRAIGIWTAVAALGFPLGPVVGGWAVEQAGWSAVFLLNLPLALLTIGASVLLVPESRDPNARGLDVPGAAFSTVALGALVFGLIEAPGRGWADPMVLGAICIAVAGGLAFVLRELSAEHPMVDVRWFGNPRLSTGVGAITIGSLALAGLTFNLTQYLQVARGYTPLEAGLAVFPLSVGFIFGAGASNRLAKRLGAKRVVTMGLALVAAALGAAATLQAATDYWVVGLVVGIFGLGVAATFVPSTASVVASVPESRAGVASALNDTARQVGAALGVAVAGSVARSIYAASMGGGAGSPMDTNALVATFGTAMIAVAAVAALGALMVALVMPRSSPRAFAAPAPDPLRIEGSARSEAA